MTRDAEVSTGDYLSLVLGAIGRESDIGVVGVVLRQLRSAIDQFAAPANRDGYRQRLADGMLELARAAAPGSDHQLTFTRVFAGVARSSEHLRIVAGLLDGSIVWEGLAIDTDLRWHLLEQLVAAGVAEDDAIEAELTRDDTATGRRRAAFARASRPTPVAKELAWADVMDRTDLPNAMLEATMGGFVQPEQLDLLRPFRARYFEDLPRVWAQRTMEMAQDITSTLYPFLLVDDETLRLTDAYLQRTDLAAAQRRLLIEGRDAVMRAQRAQARDAR
jgi:aminopeptidase N